MGYSGETGITGVPGLKGMAGKNGEAGEQGNTGPKGANVSWAIKSTCSSALIYYAVVWIIFVSFLDVSREARQRELV